MMVNESIMKMIGLYSYPSQFIKFPEKIVQT